MSITYSDLIYFIYVFMSITDSDGYSNPKNRKKNIVPRSKEKNVPLFILFRLFPSSFSINWDHIDIRLINPANKFHSLCPGYVEFLFARFSFYFIVLF